MKFKIKETCSCGALMEYEDEVENEYLSNVDRRQNAFHIAHKSCREIQTTGEMIKEIKI